MRKNVENVRFERLSKVPNFMCYHYTTFSIILHYVKEPLFWSGRWGSNPRTTLHVPSQVSETCSFNQLAHSLIMNHKKQKTPFDVNGVSCLTFKTFFNVSFKHNLPIHHFFDVAGVGYVKKFSSFQIIKYV